MAQRTITLLYNLTTEQMAANIPDRIEIIEGELDPETPYPDIIKNGEHYFLHAGRGFYQEAFLYDVTELINEVTIE
jgi:hypothetical protein